MDDETAAYFATFGEKTMKMSTQLAFGGFALWAAGKYVMRLNRKHNN